MQTATMKPTPAARPSHDVAAPRIPMKESNANAAKRTGRRRAAQLAEPISPQGLLLAFQRRWRAAVVMAVPAAIVAAAIAWLAVPAPFTAFALLRVASVEQRLVFVTAENHADFATYRRTQMTLIKSHFVLNAALRKSNVAGLSSVQEQQFPLVWLERQLQVDSYDSPEIVRIALTGDRPAELAEIVNAVKDAYLEEVVNAERKQRIARLNDLERIFEQTEEKVRLKEKRVNSLAQELGTGDVQALTIKQQMAMEYFAQLRREHARVRFELMRVQVGDQTKSGSGENGESESVDTESDVPASNGATSNKLSKHSAAAGLETELDAAEFDGTKSGLAKRRSKQLKELISRFEKQVVNKKHPTLVAYRSELEELDKELQKTGDDVEEGGEQTATSGTGKRRSRLDVLKRQEQLLREELDKYSALVKNIGTSSFELESMKTEIDQVAKVSNKVGTEMESLRIELQSPTRIAMLQEAEVPETRSVSKRSNLTSAAGMGTMGLVFLIVSVMEFHTRRITDPKDLVQTLGLELLGTLPAMPKPLLRLGSPAQSRLLLWNNALIESVDNIRSILLHSPEEGEAPKVIMIASATAGEGKTTFACQLAGSLARSGRKTLLVDCDIRRPRAHQLLQVQNSLGLSELLTDTDLRPETVIQQAGDPNLFVIAAGHMTEEALQQIARDGAASLFAAMRKEFDFVIVDSSPMLCVADSSSIGENVDGAILVARQDISRVPVVGVACERMDLLGMPLLGAVMVGVRSNINGYGYSYDYHYHYSVSGGAA